jgi:hypothetical protein
MVLRAAAVHQEVALRIDTERPLLDEPRRHPMLIFSVSLT